MKNTALLLALTVGLGMAAAWRLEARPAFGANCAQCHTTSASGRIAVVGEDSITNIGVRLDGQASVAQKAYDVQPGTTVTLSEDVLNGTGTYALELKGFEGKGLKNSAANSLIWTAPSLVAQGWTQQSVGGVTYFTSAVLQNTSPTYNFDLAVGAATAPDFYELIFAWASPDGGLSYQQEKFYLNVIPEPSVYALTALGGLGFVAFRRFAQRRQPRR